MEGAKLGLLSEDKYRMRGLKELLSGGGMLQREERPMAGGCEREIKCRLREVGALDGSADVGVCMNNGMEWLRQKG